MGVIMKHYCINKLRCTPNNNKLLHTVDLLISGASLSSLISFWVSDKQMMVFCLFLFLQSVGVKWSPYCEWLYKCPCTDRLFYRFL